MPCHFCRADSKTSNNQRLPENARQISSKTGVKRNASYSSAKKKDQNEVLTGTTATYFNNALVRASIIL